jgi:integrase
MQSREASGVTPASYLFYSQKLERFFSDLNPDTATEAKIEHFLMQFPNLGNRARYFQVIKTFYRWRELVYDIPSPIRTLKAPKVPRLILPSLTSEQVLELISKAVCIRDKAIISLFVESGLRLSELTNITAKDIDWSSRTIRVIGKGRKEALAPFGELSDRYLREWLAECPPANNIWGINRWGIATMLRRLQQETNITCNPHTFRRTFACLLRKSGVDTMTIRDLGRWESLEMVQRYTRSINFRDSLKFYKAPLTSLIQSLSLSD